MWYEAKAKKPGQARTGIARAAATRPTTFDVLAFTKLLSGNLDRERTTPKG